MIRKTMFAIATVAAIGAAALIPTQASAGGGKGGGMGGGMGGGYHGHGHWGGGFGGIVVIGPSCWRWVRGLGRVYVCYCPQLFQRYDQALVLLRETGAYLDDDRGVVRSSS